MKTGRGKARQTAFIGATFGFGWLLYGAYREFYNIAWGTGGWYGQLSAKWAMGLVAFALVCVLLLAGWIRFLAGFDWISTRVHKASMPALPGWILVGAACALPVVLFQYTPWGVALRGPYIRILFGALCVIVTLRILLAMHRSSSPMESLLIATILVGSALTVGAAFTEVTNYPFSLGWSEGNRLWDYSLLFGRRLYSFDAGHEPVAYLDFGRQLMGGLPFLLPRVSILGERLWLAGLSIIPYVVVGMTAFWAASKERRSAGILAGLFGFLFLSQGPIHAPLLASAALVLGAWHSRLLWAIPLMVIASYFAEISRFTWMFAPAMWIAMLELGSARREGEGVPRAAWQRALSLGFAGLAGSLIGLAGTIAPGGASVGSSATVSTSQALLWYRLLPNATYGEGILVGLAKAAVPLLAVTAYVAARRWRLTSVQVIIVAVSLVAFLVVGLVVSTKIGGGGDLHNLDMFLIGALFFAAVLWRLEAVDWKSALSRRPAWWSAALLVAIAVPAYNPLMSLRPIQFADSASWLRVLADVERPRDLGSLPDPSVTHENLRQLEAVVYAASSQAPVLFMDQRQLLTFGYIPGVKLIPEYEKKRMMDEALSGNAGYFASFYEDLKARRFSLIVTSPLRTPIKDSDYGFGEENNAWVRWIAKPILCYYEEKDTLSEDKTEVLVPRESSADCAAELPITPK